MMGVAVATRADPAYQGRAITEGYLTQPVIMATVGNRALQLVATLNLEGYTLQRGELNAGMYGEGYVDRRHPHTLVHEAMVVVTTPTRSGFRFSLAGGKGFTPYGTDDPMMRPFVTYPVNHHHAQIIERTVAIGAVRVGDLHRGAAVELGVFNGDEPYAPFAAPRWSRFGDSRSARISVFPATGVELQTSRAFVKSPGIVQGGAFDHSQTSASVRLSRDDVHGRGTTVLAEFARTDELLGARRIFRFESVLAEASVRRHDWLVALRAERTERPENERLLDPFRIPNGHIDFQIIGVTRWQIATVHIAAPSVTMRHVGVAVSPFVEVARAYADARRFPAVFEPAAFYGNATQTAVSVGLRVHAGTMRHRMGRYGVLQDPMHVHF